MRIRQCCVALAMLAGLALVPRVAPAQGAVSDTLTETIVNASGAIVPFLTPPGPPAVVVSIPETTGEPPAPILLPPRQFDFIEGAGPTQGHISDRLNISQYQVQVQSDDTVGLPRRTANATLIPASALESFQPVRIVATSDADIGNITQSDTLTIILGYFGPGTGTTIATILIPETVEGVAETVTVPVPPSFFDIAESVGTQSIISDYVDVQPFTVSFISSDDLQSSTLTNGIVLEGIETGAGVTYSLNFASDTDVPEPASVALMALGMVSFAGLIRRRH
jgi:hypothetical protein